jgi:hypothetical protein
MLNKNNPLFTIGSSDISAEVFFTKLQEAGVKLLIDVRPEEIAQLPGFARRDDLRFFVPKLLDAEYACHPVLEPPVEWINRYKGGKDSWKTYERAILTMLQCLVIDMSFPYHLLPGACLLGGDHEPQHCHRRLMAEYLSKHCRPRPAIVHLV